MIDSPPSPQLLVQLYEEIKYWAPLIGVAIAGYKAWDWIKEQSKVASEIKREVTESVTKLDANVAAQTLQIVGELKEMRSDMRMLYAPLLIQASGKKLPKMA